MTPAYNAPMYKIADRQFGIKENRILTGHLHTRNLLQSSSGDCEGMVCGTRDNQYPLHAVVDRVMS